MASALLWLSWSCLGYRLAQEVAAEQLDMKAVKIWYSIQNGGDGSTYLSYFPTEEEAEADQDNMTEGWGESCMGCVDTYEGSDTHNEMLQDMESRQSS